MTSFARRVSTVAYAAFIALLLSGCAPLIGPYSPTAYQNATSLKASTLALMGKAEEPYVDHAKEVDVLLTDIDKAYEYVKGIPSNSLSAKQWEILKDPAGDLLGKFILRWKERGKLSAIYISEFKGLIRDGYDEIICLEANKKSASQCNATGGK